MLPDTMKIMGDGSVVIPFSANLQLFFVADKKIGPYVLSVG